MPIFTGYVGHGTGLSGGVLLEPTDAGYARLPVTFGDLSAYGPSPNAGGGSVGPAVNPWGTLAYGGLFDAAAGGNLIASWPLLAPTSIGAGQIYTLPPGGLRITLNDAAAALGRNSSAYVAGAPIGRMGSAQTLTAGVNLSLVGGALSASAAAPGTAVRIAQVATRCQVPDLLGAPTSGTQFMARSMHYARQALTQLQVVLPNFYVKLGSGDTGTGGAATVTASIEYPAGTFTQLRFGGQVQGSISNGAMLTSDVASLSIPNGAQFWVRYWYSNPAGFPYVSYSANTVTGVDALTFGTSVADQTGGGTVAATVPNLCAYPCAVVAASTAASVGLVGDSRVVGIFDVRSDAQDGGGELARVIGQRLPYISMACAGDIATGTTASFANRALLGRFCSHVIDEYGVNDINGNLAPTAVASARSAIASMFPGSIVYGSTIPPVTTSTDNWATAGNQTVKSTEANRKAMNALIRAGVAGEANFVDIDYALDPGATGLWPTNGTGGAFTPDGLHETNLAAGMIARSGVFANLSFDRR